MLRLLKRACRVVTQRLGRVNVAFDDEVGLPCRSLVRRQGLGKRYSIRAECFQGSASLPNKSAQRNLYPGGNRQKIAFNEPAARAILPEPRRVKKQISAKAFSPQAGNANIYVNRGGGIGTAIAFQVILDGRIVGSFAPYTFHLLSVSLGEHAIGITSAENIKQAKVMAEAGRNYFYDVDVRWGGWLAGHPSNW